MTSIPPQEHTRDPALTSGPIPRIEDRPKQLEFARVANLDVVMVDMYRAERLLESGETADSLFPSATVILTTTFEDERLELWFLERELEVATHFGADVVIPCDVPIYRDDPRQQRLEDLRVYAGNIKRAAERFGELGITVIPLVKGESEYERRICYEAFAEVGLTYVAYYCAQFFLYGSKYRSLLARVRDIVREYDPERMMLVGFQSENQLPQFPPAVEAAAGFRWCRKLELWNTSIAVAQRDYETWEREVKAALQTGQSLLDSFASQPTYGEL